MSTLSDEYTLLSELFKSWEVKMFQIPNSPTQFEIGFSWQDTKNNILSKLLDAK